jgi:hypothetical protein
MRASPYDEAAEELATYWAEEVCPADLNPDSADGYLAYEAWLAEREVELAEGAIERAESEAAWR